MPEAETHSLESSGAISRLVRRRHLLYNDLALSDKLTSKDEAVLVDLPISLGLSEDVPEARQKRVAARIAGEFKNIQVLVTAAEKRDQEIVVSRKRGRKEKNQIKKNEEKQIGGVADVVAKALDSSQLSSKSSFATSASIQEYSSKRSSSTTNQKLLQLGAPELTEKPSRALELRRKKIEPVAPRWHSPWKLKQVIAGHVDWVKSVAVDPSNRFFFTGSGDRTIKVWDLATGSLKLTLTGHSHGVSALAVSSRHPYLFSCGEDKKILCWDLETNKVIRHYHGHLQAITCATVHPALDVLISGSRDASARIWDIRSSQEVHMMTGHTEAVNCVISQDVDPQIITGSMDKTVRLWDLAMGKSMLTLTHHKKGVRALSFNPLESSFVSGSADSIKKWESRTGRLMQNLEKKSMGIVNTLSCNQENVLFGGGDDGYLQFYDWQSGHCFQSFKTTPQPGSLDSEACVLASTFDVTGTRLITCEADKSIKIWKQDSSATEITHPLNWDHDLAVQRAIDEKF